MKAKQLESIRAHGEQLLAIFPEATERDPVKLCKKLRRLEAAGNVIGLRMCNGPPYSTERAEDKDCDDVLRKVNDLLGNMQGDAVPIFLNRDPRGYALKIKDGWMRKHNATLHRDWGGYGIIAPEIND